MNAGSVLALHGFLGHPVAFAGLALGRLAPQVHVPLLLGHGPAPAPPAPSFEREVERLLAEAEDLPAPRRLLGYSQGARLGLALLARRPELFERALLIGAQPGLRSLEERTARRQLEDSWIAELEDVGVSIFVDRWSTSPLFGPARDPATLREGEPHRWDHTTSGLVSALLTLGTSQMPNLWPALASVHCKVELWTGALDTKFLQIATEMARELPRATTRTFEGSYHNPLTDSPHLARERLEAWLA